MNPDIEKLSNLSEFARFIEYIYEMREASIMDLRGAKSESIQQIAGEIAACDEILKVTNWESLKHRHFGYGNSSLVQQTPVKTEVAKKKVAKKKVAKKKLSKWDS